MAVLKASHVEYQSVSQRGDITMMTETKQNSGPPQVYVDMATAQVQKNDNQFKLDDIADEQCGWGPVSPQCCQKFRNPKWICFWLCWAGAIQGMVVNGFLNVVISNIERRYNLSSTTTGTVASCYDIASALCLIPVSYFGGLGSKPRYLGVGVLIMGVGSFVFSLPHFTADLYKIDDDGVRTTCDVFANETQQCDKKNLPASLSNYKFVFFLGQLLHGAGAAPLYTLGITYLDENLPLRSSPLYIGIFYAFAIIGPAIGYLAGGAFLDLYVDINVVDMDSVAITSASPRWVGAWWIGFLISGVLAFLVAIPIAGFPKLLPSSQQFKLEREKEVYSKKERKEQYEDAVYSVSEESVLSYKQIIKFVKILVMNPTFMFLNLAAACEGNLLSGIATFMPKFIEAQFALPASTAAKYVGYAAIPAGGGGTFLGGYLVKKFDLHVTGIIRLCAGLCFAVLFLTLVFLMHCSNIPFAGVNVEYGSSADSSTPGFYGGKLDASCNTGCHCSEDIYNPICGIDGILYYSPCHAGCQMADKREQKTYSNCSCVTFNRNTTPLYEAIEGKCESNCEYLPLFLPICGVLMLLTFIASMPALSATLRCVPNEQRSFALGIQWIIARCLGSIPGPILFGKLIDITCKLWQTRLDEQGSCFFYDNRQMSYNMLAVILSGKFLSTLFFVLALILYKVPMSEIIENEESSSPAQPRMLLNLSKISRSSLSVNTAVTVISDSNPTTPVTPNGVSKHSNWMHI